MEMLRTLPDESVQCCITSPPYWGLRDYQIAPCVWPAQGLRNAGEDARVTAGREAGATNCAHEWMTEEMPTEVGKGNWAQGTNGRGEVQPGGVDAKREPIRSVALVGFCRRCGAWRGCLGLEPTPELYVEHMVTVFREVRRVLRGDGTLWLNMGDSYTSGGRKERDPGQSKIHPAFEGDNFADGLRPNTPVGCKPKDLVGIPWMLALALRADDWYLRQDIIWAKPNPMPESVRDRCTKAHEYLFLLSKSARYYYDQEAIKEPAVGTTQHDLTGQGYQAPGQTAQTGSRPMPAGWDLTAGEGRHGTIHKMGRSGNKQRKPSAERGCLENSGSNVCGSVPWQGAMRNKRSVWTITTQPFSEAHFATFPEKLVMPYILAGTSDAGCCPQCGAPWKRVFNKELVPTAKAAHTFVVDDRDAEADAQDQGSNRQKDGHKPGWANRTETTGWQAGCECRGKQEPAAKAGVDEEAGIQEPEGSCSLHWEPGCKCRSKQEPAAKAGVDEEAGIQEPEGSCSLHNAVTAEPQLAALWMPCVVLDCFMGSGTCGVVALRYGRNFIGIELNAKYVEMARKRIENEAPLWNQ